MGYVEENLIPGETVIYQTRLHWISLFWHFVGTGFLGLAGMVYLAGVLVAQSEHPMPTMVPLLGLTFVVAAAAIILLAWLRRKSSEFAVTNKRVVLKVGIVSRKTAEMMLSKVESIGVDQGLLGRIFNFGTIIVRGTGGTLDPFGGIQHPMEFRRQVQHQIDKLQSGQQS